MWKLIVCNAWIMSNWNNDDQPEISLLYHRISVIGSECEDELMSHGSEVFCPNTTYWSLNAANISFCTCQICKICKIYIAFY